MEVLGFLVLIIWLLVIPTCIGGIPAAFVDKQGKSPAFMCICGYMIMWAVFQVICVPFVLLENKYNGMFPYVVYGFGGGALLLAVIGAVLFVRKRKKADVNAVINRVESRRSLTEIVAWAVFFLLVLIQLAASVLMTYGDGDDAYYVAVSTITEASNTMYKIMPYNVGETGLDLRHGLAPFPIWIAFLARLSGLRTALVAHTAVGTCLIGLTYVIYYKIGQILFREKKESLPIFLSFTALLVMFGDHSYKTVENFMIARSRQGKAALGSIILPITIFLLLMIFEDIQNRKKAGKMLWVLLGATVTAACLCSTLGTMLMCLFLGVVSICAGVVYKNLRLVFCMAACCVPAIVYAVMYFVLG